MDPANILRTYLVSLAALKAKLESKTTRYVDQGLVEEIDAELATAYRELTFIQLPDYAKERFHSHDGSEGKWYDRDALASFLDRVLARLRSAEADKATPPGMQPITFPFVNDTQIREIVERDYRELQRASVAGCPKAKLTLAGGCIEGILYDLATINSTALSTAKSKPTNRDITRWTLGELLSVCTELKLIPAGVDKLAAAMRDYRNLVHPAVEVRERLTPGEHEAEIAVQILHILHREL